jgi:hypothetical protein
MTKHDDLLQQGPRQAPEPETAEERSTRLGRGVAGGGILGGGIALAKFGALSKIALWLFAWHAVTVWRVGSWIGLAVIVLGVAAFLVVRSRKEA